MLFNLNQRIRLVTKYHRTQAPKTIRNRFFRGWQFWLVWWDVFNLPIIVIMLSGALDAMLKDFSNKKITLPSARCDQDQSFSSKWRQFDDFDPFLVARVVGMCLNLGRKPKREEGNTQIKENSRWWFLCFFDFHHYLGKVPILTHIFRMGWNHQNRDHVAILPLRHRRFTRPSDVMWQKFVVWPNQGSHGFAVLRIWVSLNFKCVALICVSVMIFDGTVDGRNSANQLRLVVYPIIYKVLYIPGGAGFLRSTVVLTCRRCSVRVFVVIHFTRSES